MTTGLGTSLKRAHRYFPMIDEKVRWYGQDRMFVFSTGFRYQFGHCKNTDDWHQYDSNEYTHLAFDELIEFEEEQYQNIGSRVRTTDPVLRKMLKIRAMSNPVRDFDASTDRFTVKDPQWVRSYFVDPAPNGRVTLYRTFEAKDGRKFRRTRIYLPAKLHDNPDPQFVRDYEENLLSRPEHIRQALLDGNWYLAPGSYFGDSWDPNLHVCRPFRIPGDWLQFRSMDWGFKQPGVCHWYAMDPDGNLFVHRELVFQGMDVIQVAAEIERAERQMDLWKDRRSALTGPADNQLWEERGDIGKTKAAEFLAKGIHWIQADKRSRARNAQRILTRLQDHRQGTTTPGLVFFQTCTYAIRTLPVIPAHPKRPEEPLDGGDDHALDSLGYGCAYASVGQRGMSSQEVDDDDFEPDPPDPGKWGYGLKL